MKRQCNNCVWYRSFPKECRFELKYWIKKDPFSSPCTNYKPDRDMVAEEERTNQ